MRRVRLVGPERSGGLVYVDGAPASYRGAHAGHRRVVPGGGVVGRRPLRGGRRPRAGLFTGLRVGLATARAIALARKIPAVGVNSLEVLAHPYRRRTGLLATVVDARRGEVFWALYETDGALAWERRSPAVIEPEKLAVELAQLDGPVLAVGDGAWRYRDQLVAAGAEVGDEGEMWPSALAVAQLGRQRLLVDGGSGGEHTLPEPLYLRSADVRIGWEEVGGRVGGHADERRGQPSGPAEPAPPASGRTGHAAALAPEAPKLAP